MNLGELIKNHPVILTLGFVVGGFVAGWQANVAVLTLNGNVPVNEFLYANQMKQLDELKVANEDLSKQNYSLQEEFNKVSQELDEYCVSNECSEAPLETVSQVNYSFLVGNWTLITQSPKYEIVWRLSLQLDGENRVSGIAYKETVDGNSATPGEQRTTLSILGTLDNLKLIGSYEENNFQSLPTHGRVNLTFSDDLTSFSGNISSPEIQSASQTSTAINAQGYKRNR